MELLNIFMEQTQDYMIEFFGENRKTTALEIAASYIASALNESSKYNESDKGVSFIMDLKDKIHARVESILKEVGLNSGIEKLKESKYEDLKGLIQDKARG